MKKAVLFLILLAGYHYAVGQNKIIKLWPGPVPGEKSEKHPAVLRDSLQHVKRITDITDPLLTVFEPKAPDLHTGIIVAPGGGNKYLSIDMEGGEIADWLSKLGYTVFVLQYRVPMKQYGALQDMQRAIRLIKSQAATLKIDSDKVGVMGFSAGGNLSARTATSFTKRTYLPVDQSDSASCRPNFSLLIYPGSLSAGPDHKLSTEITVTKATPPTFIFVASDDPYGLPLSLAYALRDNEVPFEMHIFPKGGHGYGLRKGNKAAEAWPALAAQWLKEYIIK